MSDDEKSITIKIPKIALQKDYDEVEHKLAHLLSVNVIFCNNGWWHEEEGTPWAKDAVSLHVNCNDLFAWGCADSEDITHGEIGELYEMWLKDPNLGPAAWCIKKRKSMPQSPVEKEFRTQNIWDLDKLVKGEI